MEFLNRNKKIVFIVLTIVCIAAAIFTVDRAYPSFIENGMGYILTPIQKLNTNINNWIGSKIGFLKDINSIENENINLKKQLEEVNSNLDRLKLLEAENKRLSDLLQINSRYEDYPKVGAQIIAKDPGNWYNVFTIDKGTKDGIKKNMVVIASGGLVGRIKESGYNYSKVVSIIDDSDAVSAKSLRTDDVGFVRGNLSSNGLCIMEYIDNDAEIIEGDEIVTSHLSEIYPPGITIGYVKEIHTDNNTLTKYAIIEPTVDFKHLETILVINKTFKTELIEETTTEIATQNAEE